MNPRSLLLSKSPPPAAVAEGILIRIPVSKRRGNNLPLLLRLTAAVPCRPLSQAGSPGLPYHLPVLQPVKASIFPYAYPGNVPGIPSFFLLRFQIVGVHSSRTTPLCQDLSVGHKIFPDYIEGLLLSIWNLQRRAQYPDIVFLLPCNHKPAVRNCVFCLPCQSALIFSGSLKICLKLAAPWNLLSYGLLLFLCVRGSR